MGVVKQRTISIIAAVIMFCAAAGFVPGNAAQAAADKSGTAPKQILFINSYGYDFETVPIVIRQVSQRLRGKYSLQYLFMNEKYLSDAEASSRLSDELDSMTSEFKYSAVILGDDAAFDYALRNRDRYFKNIPLIYEDVNSVDKAEKYKNDPLISGVVEKFPMKKTIELARKVQKHAEKVVVITDNSVSGAGSAQQAMGEKKDFPDMEFQLFDTSKLSAAEIKSRIAAYSDDTILLYTVFNVDGNGKRYTLADGVKLITDAAGVPVFKADEAGLGDGLIGGYMLSYKSIGKQTAEAVLAALDGKEDTGGSYRTGSCIYEFDSKVLKRYGISKSDLPAKSVYINEGAGFFEKYGIALIAAGCAATAVFVIVLFFSLRRRKKLREDLLESRKRLEINRAANQAKTEFISRMSHDMRTPLNGIIGMTRIAREQNNSEKTEDCLDKIDTSSAFLMGLINDILDMSKIESDNIILEPAPYHVADGIKYIDAVIRPLCEEKRQELVLSSHMQPEAVPLIDALRMHQIGFNLVSNAVKYTPEEGRIEASVNTEKIDGKKLRFTMTVTDNGIGMSRDFLNTVFDPFTQENRDDTSEMRGSGLGLAIVKKLVDLMGGTVDVKSELNKGTTFTVNIIFDYISSEEVEKPGYSEAEEKMTGQLMAGRHVLLCEDNPLNQEIARALLESKGMIVETAGDGLQGVDKFKNSSLNYYDVVLMDIRMPVMDGYEAAGKIRALDRSDAGTVPIIATTADAFKGDVQKCLDAGMNAHIPKPLDPDTVFKIIAEAIGK